MIDYHIHTTLCNHAEGTMDEYIRHAIDKGLREICFLDHLTLNEMGRGLSMGPDDVPLYYYAARRLGEAHRGEIDIKVGLEIDFTPEYAGAICNIVDRFAFDAIGGSIHFVDEKNIVSSRAAKADPFVRDTAFYDRYLELLDLMLDYDCFDIICHVDVIKKFGEQPPGWFYEKMDAILAKIRYKGRVMELNTSGLTHPANAVYPDPGILNACARHQIPVTIASDAHRPTEVGRNFDQAIELLQSAGYRHVTGFDRRIPYEIPIGFSSHTNSIPEVPK